MPWNCQIQYSYLQIILVYNTYFYVWLSKECALRSWIFRVHVFNSYSKILQSEHCMYSTLIRWFRVRNSCSKDFKVNLGWAMLIICFIWTGRSGSRDGSSPKRDRTASKSNIIRTVILGNSEVHMKCSKIFCRLYKYSKGCSSTCKQLSVGNLTFITHCTAYTCPLNYDVGVCHGNTCNFIHDWTIYWVRLFKVSVFERKRFFYLKI